MVKMSWLERCCWLALAVLALSFALGALLSTGGCVAMPNQDDPNTVEDESQTETVYVAGIPAYDQPLGTGTPPAPWPSWLEPLAYGASALAAYAFPRVRRVVNKTVAGVPKLIGAAVRRDGEAAKEAATDIALGAPRIVGFVREDSPEEAYRRLRDKLLLDGRLDPATGELLPA